jgi:hypothetical protein
MSIATMAFGMGFLLWICGAVRERLRSAVADAVQPDDTAARVAGGLANAIYGAV